MAFEQYDSVVITSGQHAGEYGEITSDGPVPWADNGSTTYEVELTESGQVTHVHESRMEFVPESRLNPCR